jgi:hypothetical protein
MSNEWEAGAAPWLRRRQQDTTYGHEPNSVQCMFCGAQTVKRSGGDRDDDPGRLELYCDNADCDAREMVLLVKRDNAEAGSRADVRALLLIDRGHLDVHAAYPPAPELLSMVTLTEGYDERTERRTRKPPPYAG